MSCFQNVIIRQTVTYTPTPDTTDYLVSGQVFLEVLNIGASIVEGEITVDKIRELPTIDANDLPISETQLINSSGQTFSFNFYYPIVEPSLVVINIKCKIKVADCFYEASYNHVLITPNETNEVSSIEKVIQGYSAISGCTNPLYYEYNELANVDDGSCGNLIPIFGCTNPLSLNYNPEATYNDGTCLFKSGCTNPIAINYDSTAVIDDGSCECGDINIQLNFNHLSGESFVIEENCQYTIEFDMFSEINCTKFLEFYENDTRTPLQILNELSVNIQANALAYATGGTVEYSGGTIETTGSTEYILVQDENIYSFDSTIKPFGIGLYGDSEDCATLLELLSIELGLDCAPLTISDFKTEWKHYTFVLNSDLVGTFLKIVLNFKNFDFGVCTYIDNLEVVKICTNIQDRCVIIPTKFGFELDRVIDNKKSWIYKEGQSTKTYDYDGRETEYVEYDSRLIFNTKELELTVNPIKYIEKDVEDYFTFYEKYLAKIDNRYVDIAREKVKSEFIGVNGRQYIRQYPFLNSVYEQYQDGLDCAPTKALDYGYGLEIIEKSGSQWYGLVKQLVPSTAIWNEAQFTLKNNHFHKPKHIYKRYTLGGSSSNDEPLPCTKKIISPNSLSYLSVLYWSEPETVGAIFKTADFQPVSGGTTVTLLSNIDFIPDGDLFAANLQTWLNTNGSGAVTWLTPNESIANIFTPTISGYYIVVQSDTHYLTSISYESGGDPISTDSNISCTNSYIIDSDHQYITSLTVNGTEIVPTDTLWDMSTEEGVTAAQTTINNFIVGSAYAITDTYYLFISLPNCEDIVLTTINNCPDNIPTIECSVVTDKCLSEPFDSIDSFLSFNFGNVQCTNEITGGTIGFSGSNGDGNFVGKMVQYSTNENGENSIEDYIGFDDYVCITGDSCSINPVVVSVDYICDLTNVGGEIVNTGMAFVTVSISGGVPPYNVTCSVSSSQGEDYAISTNSSFQINLFDGDIIYVTAEDSVGCININIGENAISCPVTNCAVANLIPTITYTCIGETTTAMLFIDTIGGVAPYNYSVTSNGLSINATDIVNNGDIINVIVTDTNGCTGETSILIVCPINNELTCEEIIGVLQGNIRVTVYQGNVPFQPIPPMGHALFYNINHTSSLVSSLNTIGLNQSNIADIQYIVENLSPNLFNQYESLLPVTIANPATSPTLFSPSSIFQLNASNYGACAVSGVVNLKISVKYVIEYGDLTCQICATTFVDANYFCLGFGTTTISDDLVFSLCEPIPECEAITFQETWTTSAKYPDFIYQSFIATRFNVLNSTSLPNYVGVLSHIVTINSIDNGIITIGTPSSTTPTTSFNILFPSNNTQLFIEYPDTNFRTSNINLTTTLILENGCEYTKTYDIVVDGDSTIGTDVTTGILNLTII